MAFETDVPRINLSSLLCRVSSIYIFQNVFRESEKWLYFENRKLERKYIRKFVSGPEVGSFAVLYTSTNHKLSFPTVNCTLRSLVYSFVLKLCEGTAIIE